MLTGADLACWEGKPDAVDHFEEGALSDILSEWASWEPVLTGLGETLGELGLLVEAEKLELRAPVHDYFNPVFATGWSVPQLNSGDMRQTYDKQHPGLTQAVLASCDASRPNRPR